MRVAVLMGGTSDERDVSLSSGAEVADALREAGHEVVAVDTTHGLLSREEEARLLSGGVDAAPPGASDLARLDERHTVALTRDPSLHDIEVFFLALHGGSGEDGTLQALLAIHLLTGTPVAPVLRVFDGRTLGWREVAFKKDPGCPVCGAG